MKVLLLVLALTAVVMSQTFPDISGKWVSDNCEQVTPGSMLFIILYFCGRLFILIFIILVPFYYFRTYEIEANGHWMVTAKLYGAPTVPRIN